MLKMDLLKTTLYAVPLRLASYSVAPSPIALCGEKEFVRQARRFGWIYLGVGIKYNSLSFDLEQ